MVACSKPMTVPEHRPFPGRLYHRVPSWVQDGAIFHIRVRSNGSHLTESTVATALLESVRLYHESRRWHVVLFVLMLDHWHSLLVFPPGAEMSKVIGGWKSFQAKRHGLNWQPGYFDHRIRDEPELAKSWNYIRENPVAKGLCRTGADRSGRGNGRPDR